MGYRMKSTIKSITTRLKLIAVFSLPLFAFQNCSENIFESVDDPVNIKVCNNISCELDPVTTKPAVTTILLALGDEANNQLVIKGGSSQLIAESAIRLSSPVTNPKILIVQDYNVAAEHPTDLEYVETVLLQRYDVTTLISPSTGITIDDLDGYDLVWFNNPGAPFRFEQTRDALLAFEGGVILEGDDLTWGRDFILDELTGLTTVNNGTSVNCNAKKYSTDNNTGSAQFRVKISGINFTGAGVSPDLLEFNYGNDIDLSFVSRPGLQVLATAKATPIECTDERPTIVRYEK